MSSLIDFNKIHYFAGAVKPTIPNGQSEIERKDDELTNSLDTESGETDRFIDSANGSEAPFDK